jgi:glycosyltransferase involved in cell wall biosynthesis
MRVSHVADQPVFGFVLFGGPLTGALIRDVRLANELARRGYRVHVWWAMDRCEDGDLHRDITQHWLFSGMRFGRIAHRDVGRGVKEAIGRFATRVFSDRARQHYLQRRPALLDWLMRGLIQRVCRGVDADRRLNRRFARELTDAGVTHVLPMLSILCPFVQAARARMPQPAELLVTFQGYELYANYARAMGCEAALYQRLREVVAQSGREAIAVSSDYARRIHEDMGVPLDALHVVAPGVPVPDTIDREAAMKALGVTRPRFRADLPLVTYMGRQDAEKGIDLLLYAAAILQRRGVPMQLAICGPTLFGDGYQVTCNSIAENLRCPIAFWKRRIDETTRTQLLAASTCVVYPSIHREPFGMVPVEAMAFGTPAIVPDRGGVCEVIEADGACGGLRFNAWDSGDLARQIERLLGDRSLWARLSHDGPHVARCFSIARMADQVLDHLDLLPGQSEMKNPNEALATPSLAAVS